MHEDRWVARMTERFVSLVTAVRTWVQDHDEKIFVRHRASMFHCMSQERAKLPT